MKGNGGGGGGRGRGQGVSGSSGTELAHMSLLANARNGERKIVIFASFEDVKQ